MKLLASILLLGVYLFLFGCSGGGNGGGTETGDPGPNTANMGFISGKTQLDTNDFISLGESKVWLDDQFGKSQKTGKDGSFAFENVTYGEHVIFAEWTSSEGLILAGKSSVIEIGKATSKSDKPFVYIGEVVKMNDPAYISGMGKTGMTLKLLGTSFELKITKNGPFAFGPLPIGSYTLRVTEGSKQIYNDSVTLYKGETFELPE